MVLMVMDMILMCVIKIVIVMSCSHIRTWFCQRFSFWVAVDKANIEYESDYNHFDCDGYDCDMYHTDCPFKLVLMDPSSSNYYPCFCCYITVKT
jgi:hypothetical protein